MPDERDLNDADLLRTLRAAEEAAALADRQYGDGGDGPGHMRAALQKTANEARGFVDDLRREVERRGL